MILSKVRLKWKLTFKALELVFLILLLKLVAVRFNLEIFSLNSLYGAIVSGNVFLIGFLTTGVLSDYKESEKLPNEIAMCLDAITDELIIAKGRDNSEISKEGLGHISLLSKSIHKWFFREIRTREIFSMISKLNDYFLVLEKSVPPNFIVRLKQEQSNLRRFINRIHTIRETSFNASGYAIAEIITTLMCVALIFTGIDPWFEGLFFLAFVSFMTIYMVIFIKDLDNPFGYYNHDNLSENISLKSIDEVVERIEEKTTVAK